ncbi:MAG TPA: ribosome biogenesis GTPase Der [Vicinamibacterales bacterium]|nr:ribosome biogenesis GTPase Der [Vicinamibacterales bacterium]
MAKRVPAVVLVGRPNVGKSTLFNRITGSRRAIVAPVPGTTRDTIAQPVVWRGVQFQLIDTGGLFGASQDPLQELVVAHGRKALESADLLVFVVDGREGLVPGDHSIARQIRQLNRPVVVVINKTDDRRARDGAMEFYQLGFDPVMEISAEHGQGVSDLLDEVSDRLPSGRPAGTAAEPGKPEAGREEETAGKGPRGRAATELEEEERVEPAVAETGPSEVAVAIVGRPNVGKSSLVNRLLREERVLVSDMPGTTRDAIDTVMKWHRRQFRIIDTAGIRRPGRISRSGKVEAVSVLAARKAIELVDVAALVVDAVEGITDQDAAIAGEAARAGKGIIIVANKWDLMKERGPDASKVFDEELRFRLKFLDYVPVLHISARTGERASKLLEMIDRVAEARKRRVPTAELNKFVEAVTAVHPPASPGRKHVRILYAAQIGTAPPLFVFFTNVATTFHFSYERFLANQLRESFGFLGTPIRIQVRRRAK